MLLTCKFNVVLVREVSTKNCNPKTDLDENSNPTHPIINCIPEYTFHPEYD